MARYYVILPPASVCPSVYHKPDFYRKFETARKSKYLFNKKNCLKLWTPEKFSHVLSSVVNLPVKGRVKVAHTRLPSVGFRS